MIILEGMDNSGKSSLAEKLSKAYDMPIIHPGGAPATVTAEDIFLRDQLLDVKKNVIYDRVTSISQQVYACDKHTQLDKLMIYARAMVQFEEVTLIYCRPSISTIYNMAGHAIKEYDTPEHVDFVHKNAKRLIERYDALMLCLSEVAKGRFITYNWEVASKMILGIELRERIKI